MAATANPTVDGLKRHQSALIDAHWSNIVENLSPPGVAWEWSESGVAHRTKYRWKCDGLIYRAPCGERWMTSRRLWRHVVERAGEGESVGVEATGEKLLMDVRAYEARLKSEDGGSKRSRVYTDPDPPAKLRRTVEQVTLDGGTADTTEINNDPAATNREKATPAENAREEAANAAGQTRIGAFTTRTEPAVFDPTNWFGPNSKAWRESLTS